MVGLMLLTNNCEDVESVGTKALLERAGIKVVTATFSEDKVVNCTYKTKIIADLNAYQINPDDYEFLIIPGGIYVTRTITADSNILDFVKNFSKKNKLMAAICAAPMYFGELGLLENRNYTMFPDLYNPKYNGEFKRHMKVVRDGNYITGRSVGAVTEFAAEIVKYLLGAEKAKKLLAEIFY